MKQSLACCLALTSLLLFGCAGQHYVTGPDGTPHQTFDTTPISTVDHDSPLSPTPSAPTVVHANQTGFVPPPVQSGEALPPDAQPAKNANSVTFWVWNDRGSSKLTLAQGEQADNSQLGISVAVDTIGNGASGPKAYLLYNGKPLPTMGVDDQAHIDKTYILVTEIFLGSSR